MSDNSSVVFGMALVVVVVSVIAGSLLYHSVYTRGLDQEFRIKALAQGVVCNKVNGVQICQPVTPMQITK